MSQTEGCQGAKGIFPLFLWRVRVDGGVLNQFAGAIYYGHFNAGTQAGVQAEGWAQAGRCRQKQVFQVFGKDLDGFVFGIFPNTGHQLGLQLGQQLNSPGPAYGLF